MSDASAPPVPLLLLVAAPPTTWTAHLILNYTLASRVCFSGLQPLTAILPPGHLLWFVLPFIDVVALTICAGTIVATYRLRQLPETPAHAGRTRFLAQWSVILGGGFFIATLFDAVAVFMVPLCAT
jgi:hypothetical protein